MSKPEEGIRTVTLWILTNSNSLSTNNDSSLASGMVENISAMKPPGANESESVPIIFPLNFTILNDFIVLIPAGAAAPGTMTTSYLEFNYH